MKRKLLVLCAIVFSAFTFAEEKRVFVEDDYIEATEITRSVILHDYLQVVNNELFIYSENNVTGSCHYIISDKATIVLDATVPLLPYGNSMIPVKSLPVGEYIIEVETPSTAIRKVLIITTMSGGIF